MAGALVGSRIADRLGPKPVVAGSFLIGAIAIALLTLSLPIGLLLLFVAIVGLGTNSIFYVLGGLALLGVVLTLLVPTRSVQPDRSTTTLRPSRRAAVANASGASSSGNRCEVDHDRSTAPRTASAIARR